MQWTPNGLVPANGYVPNGETKPGVVLEDGVAAVVVEVAKRKPDTKKLTPKNVVALAKARLREVKSELRKLKALEKEKGELERLIAAAENKPQKSNLRDIKRSTG